MHPSVIADALPPSLAGKALRTAAPLESLPLQGRWMRRKAQTEGYGAFLGLYLRGLAGACRRVALPHCLLACCLPQSQAPLCRERCLHRPAKLLAGANLPVNARVVPQTLRPPSCCPAGEIARPTDQGKRQAEQGTSSLRPAFIYLVARLRQIVGRAFTPAAKPSVQCGFSGPCLLLPANPPPATSPCAKAGASRRAPTPLPPDFLSTPPACGPPKFLIPNF